MKKIAIGLLVLFLLGFGGIIYMEKWLSANLPAIVNQNEDRNYDILFEDVDIRIFGGSIDFQNIMIVPLNDSLPTTVNGSVRKIRMSGVKIMELVFDKKVNIKELKMEEPAFRLIRNDSTGRPAETSKAFQDLFRDIVSRGLIENFVLEDGTAELYIQKDTLVRFGQFTDLNILAEGLKTDSVTVLNTVPFQVDNIQTSLKNLQIQVSENQLFKMGALDFDYKNREFAFQDMSLKFKEPWTDEVKKMDVQLDMIEFDLRELKIISINTNSDPFGQWTVIADKIILDSLVFHDGRDKNIPRPPDVVKEKIEELIESIPFPVKLDTLQITNSDISYSEIPKGKSEPGTIYFKEFNAIIFNVSSIDSVQRDGDLLIQADTKLNGVGAMEITLKVPYNTGTFNLLATLGPMDMAKLNPTLELMASVKIGSGKLRGMVLEMEADGYKSKNRFVIDYQDLEIDLSKVTEDGVEKKNEVLSKLANLGINRDNLPGNKSYRTPFYTTIRNRYRSPFNLIWLSAKDGFFEVIPSGLGKKIMDVKENRENKPKKN
ncbi:MAG: hypothetical protein PSV36_08225 [Algoriphagus sp.]|nr:hypothetical protein [Algoriphagus sp.]